MGGRGRKTKKKREGMSAFDRRCLAIGSASFSFAIAARRRRRPWWRPSPLVRGGGAACVGGGDGGSNLRVCLAASAGWGERGGGGWVGGRKEGSDGSCCWEIAVRRPLWLLLSSPRRLANFLARACGRPVVHACVRSYVRAAFQSAACRLGCWATAAAPCPRAHRSGRPSGQVCVGRGRRTDGRTGERADGRTGQCNGGEE